MSSDFISVDDHVLEPPDLWTSRIPKDRWGDRIPRLEKNGDGKEQWVVDGRVLLGGRVAQAGALMPDRNEEPSSWSDVPEEAYVPARRLQAMDAAGENYAVLYPTVSGLAGEAFGTIEDPELELACVQAYNDWLLEEWAAASERFIPQCIVPISSSEATVAEIRRAVGNGHKGVIFPALPMDLRGVPHVAEPDYDKVWAVCAELGVPLCLHAGASPTLEYERYTDLAPNLRTAIATVAKPVSSVYVLGLYLFSRILMRHPELKVVLAESALSWALLYLEWADHQADHDGLANEGYELTPSEMFHRQCYLTAWYDEVAPFAPYLHADNIMWSSNLPLATSTWPGTQSAIDRCLEGVSESERKRILWDNAAALYGV
ncbi:MAG: amidohydrolase family protein [Alphaproteobacteria bacterium]|nr:amidohydrolase family protein [Alphaproteobacteria bacterium]